MHHAREFGELRLIPGYEDKSDASRVEGCRAGTPDAGTGPCHDCHALFIHENPFHRLPVYRVDTTHLVDCRCVGHDRATKSWARRLREFQEE